MQGLGLTWGLALVAVAFASGATVGTTRPPDAPLGTATPVGTPPAVASGMPMPGPLAEPILPVQPGQADYGAQVFWFHCMSCHGDRGQGLTAAFRMLYPPDHQYCWSSHCHGGLPNLSGWTLPTQVPAVIGDGSLDGFETAATLYAFVHLKMPYQAPGSLTDQEYWEVTAYLVRANGADPIRVPLDEVRASQIRMNPARQILLTPTPEGSSKQPPEILIILAAGVGAIALLLAGFVGARALLRTQQK